MKLHLPLQSHKEARVRRWLGSGWRYPFTVGDCQGELRLLPSGNPGTATVVQHFYSDAGMLALSDPAPVLALLADCPLLTGEDVNGDGWYWSFFNQQLSKQIIKLLGKLSPVSDVSLAEIAPLTLRLQVLIGEQIAHSLLQLSLDVLQQLATQASWQRLYNPLDEMLPLKPPLLAGRLALSTRRIAALQCGDVLLPSHPFFTPDGQGVVVFAQHQFHGQLTPSAHPGEPDLFHITLREDLTMSHPNEPITSDEEPEMTAGLSNQPNEPCDQQVFDSLRPGLDALPLELTIRCGHLQLTLGELQQLDTGSTIIIEHVIPGEAVLCHGDFFLAKGELVDVDGHLGLQITSMICNQPLEANCTL